MFLFVILSELLPQVHLTLPHNLSPDCPSRRGELMEYGDQMHIEHDICKTTSSLGVAQFVSTWQTRIIYVPVHILCQILALLKWQNPWWIHGAKIFHPWVLFREHCVRRFNLLPQRPEQALVWYKLELILINDRDRKSSLFYLDF